MVDYAPDKLRRGRVSERLELISAPHGLDGRPRVLPMRRIEIALWCGAMRLMQCRSPQFHDAPFEGEAPPHRLSLRLANKPTTKQAIRQVARSPRGPLPLALAVPEGLTLAVCEHGVEFFGFGVGKVSSERRRR